MWVVNKLRTFDIDRIRRGQYHQLRQVGVTLSTTQGGVVEK